MTQVPQIKVETPEFLLQYREKLRNSNLNWSSVLLIIASKSILCKLSQMEQLLPGRHSDDPRPQLTQQLKQKVGCTF